MKRVNKYLPVLLLAAGGVMTLTAQKSHDAALARNFNSFSEVVKNVEQLYVDTIDIDKSFSSAIEAFLAETDPYTEYYTADQTEVLKKMSTGEYEGIGAYLVNYKGGTCVSAPIEGSPAAKAGLRHGDHIVKVDTTDVATKSSDVVSKLLKGTPGTKVKVLFHRPYVTDSIREVVITRGKVKENSIPYYGKQDNIGIIKVSSFIDMTPEEFRAALDSLSRDSVPEGLIIDLRSNGGGVVESAVDIAGFFVPKGTEIVTTKGRNTLRNKTYKTPRKPLLPDIPLAILMDGGSASSSEILAGSLQDLDRAVLIGSRSFGKGLVQSPVELPYGALMKVTIAKYYLPSGRLIQAIDYSRRNPDGSVARVPDSLTNVFKTLRGREVRDGGGLRPDSTIEWREPSRLLYNAVTDNWIFDYANKYVAEHPEKPALEEFVVTDEIYDGFKKSIDPERFKYDKACEEMMNSLRKVVQREGYMNDRTSAQIDSLASLLTHDLNQDLDTHRDELSDYLGSEILSRWYYETGKEAYSTKNDRGIETAKGILKNPALYRKILRLK